MENIGSFAQTFVIDIGYVILGVLVLTLAKILKDIMTPYKVDEELTISDNPALGVSISGYYAGVFAIFIGAFADSGDATITGAGYDLAVYHQTLKKLFLRMSYFLPI